MMALKIALAPVLVLTLSTSLVSESRAEPARSTAQCPAEHPACRGVTASNPLLAPILSVQPKSAVLIFNKDSTPIQFQYFDPTDRIWKKQTAEMTSVRVVVCSACQNSVKIFFHDSVENKQSEVRLGSFNIFIRSEDSGRWQLLTP
jgi:hypothetical protein